MDFTRRKTQTVCREKRNTKESKDDFNWEYLLLVDARNAACHLGSTKLSIAIKDRYPKARFHYLVLPRKDVTAPQILTVHDLTVADIQLLEDMLQLAQQLAVATGMGLEQFKFGYHMGAHMKPLHMHVISRDFDSPSLKRVRHWNIFNEKIFLTHADVVRDLLTNGKVQSLPEDEFEAIRNGPMTCSVCGYVTTDLLFIKIHILKHFPRPTTYQNGSIFNFFSCQ
ncbi:aprataxin [Anopheles darlingi]|uniref:aprataxin n=1 Tax=Anopheles darlingi TaxID=43151 RepID=UPI002100317C|nr:aprataxin [Anopheles darlingi]